MLASLSIQGLALVDRIELSFDPALNVLTGETGAGKSLILGSIGLLLGERLDPDWLRAGEARGFVEGILDLKSRPDLVESLHALDVETEEGRVILRREIASDGKSRALVNGRTVLLGQLRAVGDLLVDLHGQHEHQQLLRAESQADFYDGWAGLLEERRSLDRERTALLEESRALRADLAAADQRRAEWERIREDLAELSKAALKPGEEEALKAERERLRGRERLLQALGEARHALAAEEGGAEGHVRRAARTLRGLASAAPDHEPLASLAEALLDSLGDVAGRIEDAEAHAVEEPFSPDEIEDRLDWIHRLKRKHRVDFEALLDLRESLEAQAKALDPEGRDIERRASEVKERTTAFETRLERLLAERGSQRSRFQRELGVRLGRLGFQKASIAVSLVDSARDRARPAIDPTAIPGLEFEFQPNTGEPARPLKRIASGGELSRVMLAVKSLRAERDQVAVLVFDEVDQGIGGAVGEEVGRMLRAIADRRQVLCITHLPLIAAQGVRHFEVVKSGARGRTRTTVRALGPNEREQEIARLLAGARVTATTRRQARELLHSARSGATAPPARKRAASGG